MCVKWITLQLRQVVTLAAIVAFITACTENDTKNKPLDVGDLMPDIQFTDVQGVSYSTSELTGYVVVLNYWASWCAPCREEMPSLQRLSDALDKDKFKVVGISVDDDTNLATEFLLQHNITFKNLLDPNQNEAINRFGITAYPETMIISADGKIMRKILGEQAWDSPGMIALLEGISTNNVTQTGSFAFGRQ